jgi:peptidyl-prolyl cis-trans isomerase D
LYFRKPNIKLTTIKWQFYQILDNVPLMIAVIAFALFAFIIGDLFSSGGFSTSKDVGSINGKDISFEDFRIKVSNVEKSTEGITSTAAANRVWDKRFL